MSPAARVLAVPESMTRRLAAVVLVSQAPVLLFAAVGARALADSAGGSADGTRYLLIGAGLAVLALVAAGLLRSRAGIPLGWLVQLASLLAVLVVPVMLVVGLVFGALWVVALRQGRRMDALTRARQAALREPSG